ncbi:hypothetical protein Terro_4236 [Terriglobus roseus DSM 18391]|uniref:Uncharacterized protein n=1 Tax=Terriglobus roseus (strain DSM 18391 / NRRL B-41598 / KBS 63) TaxID=926566 RepID=I3ZMH2_TERRK|nr:hypothetical protein [Terriglobus roseus]AFL90440.1 hypothetical protein Terro_4236 [Terriglobus roseus DSM 18391]
MSFFWNESKPLLKRLITASAVCALLGAGTCGVSAISGAGHSRFFAVVAMAGGVVFLLSVHVLVVSSLILSLQSIVRFFRR